MSRPVSMTSAEHYVWGDGCDGWLLASNDDLLIIQERMPAGTSEVRHFHRRAQQFFFVLDGELTLEKEGEVFQIGAREGIQIDPGIPHQAGNNTDNDTVFLVISAPGSRGDRVEPQNA